jgi:PAS domain S-box-containing protein
VKREKLIVDYSRFTRFIVTSFLSPHPLVCLMPGSEPDQNLRFPTGEFIAVSSSVVTKKNRRRRSDPASDVSPPADDSNAVPPASWLDGGIAVVDAHGRIISINDALAKWLDLPPGESTGRLLPELLGKRHADWGSELQHLLATDAPFDRVELRTKKKDISEHIVVEVCTHGDARFIRIESEIPPARDLENLFPENSWSSVAIHSAFQRMLRAEAQLENLLHRWPGIIFSQRPDFSFAFISPRVEELTGVPAPEWSRHSKYFWQVVHEADAKPLMARLREAARSSAELTGTFRIRHIKTGRVSYLWEHRQPVRSSNGLLLGYEGIWLDISRQTIAERRLLNLSWKESLGTLTMGLAHDFCNIMTGIVSLSEVFEAELGENESLRDGLSMIKTTAIEAGQLTHRIRQLHHGTPGEKNYHDLNEIVSGLAAVLQKVLPRRVRVRTELEKTQLPVYLDEVEARQVIINLALNAADAMPSGGDLIFRTARHELAPAATENLHGALPKTPMVSLSIQDTGTGIPPSLISSIFDPFFTTKPLGKGSGLGLYNARLFVEKHHAAISVESREKVGTTFHLWLAQANFTEAETLQKADQLARHTLLLVGPAEDVLNRIADQLRENGYYVATATNEADALEKLHSPSFQFTGLLVICSRPNERLPLVDCVLTEQLPLKTFCLVNGNQDELETTFLQKVDAVLPFGAPTPELLARLKSILGAPPNSN